MIGKEVRREGKWADDVEQDGTLIKTQSGNKFAKNEGDWRWWHDCVPGKLKALYDEGCVYVFVISPDVGCWGQG